MKIVCDACQAKYSIADDKIQGKAFKIRCKKCNHVIVVRGSGEGAASAGASADKAKAAQAAAPAAEQGVWHIVVDGEQVGPLTEAEVKERLRQGKANSETLVWKEGFADWTQLSAVPELSALLARITQHPVAQSASHEPGRTTGSMREVAASSAEQSAEEADPFAAATVVSPAGASDLVASSAAPAAVSATVAPAPSSPFLFGGPGGAAQTSEPAPAKSSGNGAGGTQLTGQRNENSVLFSLSNLEALAVPSQSPGHRVPSSSSNTEGSGLIDIRSMAAVTLGESGSPETRRSADGLPTFSTPQFSPVAPVLLPMSTSGPPKWVYPVLGLLAVGILVLGYGILKVVTAPPPGTPPAVAAPRPVAPAAPAAAARPVANRAVRAVREAPLPAKVEEKPAASAQEHPAEKSREARTRSERGHHRGSGQSASANRGTHEARRGATAAAAHPSRGASAPSRSSGKRGGSLDDLLGDMGSHKGGQQGNSKPAVKLVNLTQSDIVSAMRGVQPRVQSCANRYKVPGTALATINVAAGGRVTSVRVKGQFAGTPTGSCVEQAAKAARFPHCQSMSFPWPFTLSPR